MAEVSALVMTKATAFEVSYVINPWMRPMLWRESPAALRARAKLCWQQLHDNLRARGIQIHLVEAVPGLPDLVFPANAAVVLERRVLLSRFAHVERRGEEPVFNAFFQSLQRDGVVESVASLPPGIVQEGAGDCLWDAHRQLFWVGYGQRSCRAAAEVIADYFACDIQPLELVDSRFYHLDIALAVLESGELLYCPRAFSPAGLAAIHSRVPAALRIEVTEEEAAQFCINTVSLHGCLYMTPPGKRLAGLLAARGYHLYQTDLTPFLLAGGGAACLTLRLDYRRHQERVSAKEDSAHEHRN
jgi:N-dimethylarginine dimethylaminohydrolase